MMVQLVASGRGVCALPNWVAAEYLARDWVKSVSFRRKRRVVYFVRSY
jgi:LysR family transcriptional regulator for metE and metH